MHSERGTCLMATSGFDPTNQRKRRRRCRLQADPAFCTHIPAAASGRTPAWASGQQHPLLGGVEGLDVPSKHEAIVHTGPSHASTPLGGNCQ